MLSPAEQIKERLSIVEVVSSYVKLHKAGKNYKGISPFSNEKTPSFFVSPERDMYYCFSTNQGGDIFTFVEKVEGLDFSGSLKLLADRAGIALRQESKEVRDKRGRLYDVLEAATAYYETQLQKHPEVSEYLLGRGIHPKTITHFRIGYALPEWRSLYEDLLKKGFTEGELRDAGLIKAPEQASGQEKRHYDRFRGRIMFPILDSAGRVVAFSGRIVVDDGKSAKYINSPETTLYNKSKLLYAYSLAKGGIKKFNFSILVEGQMDVVLSHQAGYPNTVGVSGTALTADQLALLNRLSKNVVMAFDADRAGVASAGKGAELALSMGMDVKVVRLPQGQDPADVIHEDPLLWKKAVKESAHIVEFYLSLLRESVKDERSFKLRVQEKVLPFIARIKNAIDQNHFIHLVAGHLNVTEEVIAEEVRKVPLTSETPFHSNESGDQVSPKEAVVSEPNDSVAERIAHIILWQRSVAEPLIDTKEVSSRFEEILGKDRVGEFLEMPTEREHEHAFKTELLYENDTGLAEDVATLLQTLEYRVVKQKFEETLQALRIAEREGNAEETERLLMQSKDIADTLRTYVGKM